MAENSCIKNIEIGKFYFVHDDSTCGHPGYVIWKDDLVNRYLVIRTDSDKKGEVPKIEKGVRHITKLSHIIGGDIICSYVKNRPMLCKRKDLGILLPDLSFHPDDMKIVEEVSKREPQLSRSLRPRKKK